MATIVRIFLVLCLLSASASGQQCMDDQGNPVDWYIGYKTPGLKTQTNALLKKGVGFIYLSSKNSTANWRLSPKSINDSTSFLGRTLAPIYAENGKKLLYLLYNDEPPSGATTTSYGHSKGVVITDGNVGLWLVHSAPKFPVEPSLKKKKIKNFFLNLFGIKEKMSSTKYQFPPTAVRFGQSFLCITLPASQMNKVGAALQYVKPKVYSSNIPEALESKFQNLTILTKSRLKAKPAPYVYKADLKTVGGRTFTSYAKSKEFNKDLYSDWVAPNVESDLQVETWSNGPNELPSDCKSKYHVMDVKDVTIDTAENFHVEFKNSQDHSKWAVSDANSTLVCIGDINRMLSQFKRGGGTVCYKNTFVWKKYVKAVADVQPCGQRKARKARTVRQKRLARGKRSTGTSPRTVRRYR